MDSADWQSAAAVKLVVIQVPGGAPAIVAPPGSLPPGPVARALFDIRITFMSMLANLRWQYSEFAQKGLATQDRLREVDENNSAFFAKLACSDAVFHVAMEIVEAKSDQSVTILSGIFSKCLAMGFLWENPMDARLRELIAARRDYERLAACLLDLVEIAPSDLKESYDRVSRDIDLRLNGIPRQLDPDLVGTRGGAFGDDQAAMRGWFIRELDALLPPFKNARYAIIAQLLEISGINAVDSTKVRAVIRQGRIGGGTDLP